MFCSNYRIINMSSFGAPRENKFYTGSKHSNTWVKDLLWRRYCLREGEALGVKSLKPPLMAMHKGEFAMDDQAHHPLGGRRRLGTPGSLSRSGRNLASGSSLEEEVETLRKLLDKANLGRNAQKLERQSQRRRQSKLRPMLRNAPSLSE